MRQHVRRRRGSGSRASDEFESGLVLHQNINPVTHWRGGVDVAGAPSTARVVFLDAALREECPQEVGDE